MWLLDSATLSTMQPEMARIFVYLETPCNFGLMSSNLTATTALALSNVHDIDDWLEVVEVVKVVVDNDV